MDKRQPIGVFDSGIGGLSVMRELFTLMPNENYIYYGDSANAPYGTKPQSEVRRLALNAAEHLASHGIKELVVACNTATSAAVDILRRTYSFPVIGLEPAVKPAALCREHPTVLVLATEFTLKEKKYAELAMEYSAKAEIIPLPAPGIVEFAEAGILQGSELEAYLNALFEPYRDTKLDAVVLGCTHFPLVRRTIEKCLSRPVMIFDGGYGAAKEAERVIEEANLAVPSDARGSITFENSLGEDAAMRERALFGKLLDIHR